MSATKTSPDLALTLTLWFHRISLGAAGLSFAIYMVMLIFKPRPSTDNYSFMGLLVSVFIVFALVNAGSVSIGHALLATKLANQPKPIRLIVAVASNLPIWFVIGKISGLI